ncbi:PilZ domain-containing protein [Pseudoalteromonas sp. SSDWG2]|uniref:PilZ domain-containing protein n=1 Tax=Pseudoalteromonas sp. SSDWG2 TaxID=3139391 RepID=UPI003BAD90C9
MARTKGELFAEFFQIQEPVSIVVEPVREDEVPGTVALLERDIPPLFKLANEVNTLEQSALRPLRLLGETANELAHYLQLQSRKIDLILSHILMQQNTEKPTEKAKSYGGSGFVVVRDTALDQGQFARCKLFLDHEAAAIYCYGEVIEVSQCKDGFEHKLLFCTIREQDQELLVRASLHAQTRQLKKRHEEKQDSEQQDEEQD